MPLVFRSMYVGDDGPKVGATRCCLGVRPDIDVKPDDNGNVHPQRGKGLSVCPSIVDLPAVLIPKRLKAQYPKAVGDDRLVLWKLGTGPFVEEPILPELPTLVLRPDKPGHGTISPHEVMALAAFQLTLAATRPFWQSAEAEVVRHEDTAVS